MTLGLQGFSIETNTSVELSLDVFEPDFSLTTSIDNPRDPAHPIEIVFSGTVQLLGARYLVNYDLSWKIPTGTQTARGGAGSVTYRNLSVQGSAYLHAGQPEAVLNEQGKRLLLTIKPSPKTAGAMPASPVPASGSSGGAAIPANPGPFLPDNVTLAVKGTFDFGIPVDFSWTGAGPQFSRDNEVPSAATEIKIPAAANAIILQSVKGVVRATKDGYWLDFTFGVSLPNFTESSSPRGTSTTTTVTYRNLAYHGSVNLKPGQPEVVLEHNGKSITVTLTKPDPGK